MTCSKKVLFKTLAAAALFSAQFGVHAAGMVPETSLLVIDEATHSGTINVKNTDSHPSLLYTDVVDLPDDKGLKLVTTQPVVRLEPGQTQQLRFILQTSKPLDVEHYKRVTFEGIPPKSDDNKVKIGINIRQDLPVLIRPAKLVSGNRCVEIPRMDRVRHVRHGKKPKQICCASGTERGSAAFRHQRIACQNLHFTR